MAFIAVVAAVGMVAMGSSLSAFYNGVGSSLAEMSCAMPEHVSDKGKGKSNKCKDKNP